MAELIRDRFTRVRGKINDAAARFGRNPSSVELIAVSKTKPSSLIREAYDTGQRHFGENRVQELEEKAPQFPKDCIWHFIGTLQRNKVRKVLQHASVIHSVDSQKLLAAISRISGEIDRTTDVFLQIHIGDEQSKHGFDAAEVTSQLPDLLALPHICIRGLMCIPPPAETEDQARAHFRALRCLRDELASLSGHTFADLSMGMSGDFPAAIAEGATHIRIGSSLFGGRG